MKKTMSILCAAVLCFGASACSSGTKENSVVSVSEQLHSYKAVSIDMAEQFSEINTLGTGGSGAVLVFGKLRSGGWSEFVTDGKFSDYKEFRFTPQEDETVQSAAMLSYGKKGVLTRRGSEAFIYIYGTDNNLEKALECGEILEDSGSNMFMQL